MPTPGLTEAEPRRAPPTGAASSKSQTQHRDANGVGDQGKPGSASAKKDRRQIALPFEQAGALSDVQLEALIRAQGKRVPMQAWEIDAFVDALRKRHALDKGLAIVYEYAGRLDSIKMHVDRRAALFDEAMLAAPTKQKGTSPQVEAEFSLLFSAMVDKSVSALREISLLRRLQWCPRPILCNSTTTTAAAGGKKGASTRLTFQASLRRQTLSILEAISGSMGGHLLDVLSPLHLAVFLAPSLSFKQAAAYFHMQESEHPPHDDHYHLIEQLFIAVRNILYLEDGVASLYRSFHPKGAGASRSEETYNTFPLLRMVYQGYTFPTTQFRWFWDAGAVYRTSSDVVYFSMNANTGKVQVPPNRESPADRFFDSFASHVESSVDDVSYTIPASQYFGNEAALQPLPDGAVSISSGNNSIVDISLTAAAEELATSAHVDEMLEAVREQGQSLAHFLKEKPEHQRQTHHDLVRQWSHEAIQTVTFKAVDVQRQQTEQDAQGRERARSAKENQNQADLEGELAIEDTRRIARAKAEKQRQSLIEEEEERAAARRRTAELEQAEQEIAQLRRLRAIAEEERRVDRERRQLEEQEDERRAKQKAERQRREEQEAAKAAAELKRLEAAQKAKAAKAAADEKKLLDKAALDKKKADKEEAKRANKERADKEKSEKKQPTAAASVKKVIDKVPVPQVPIAAEEGPPRVQAAAKKLVAPKSPTSVGEGKNPPTQLALMHPPTTEEDEDEDEVGGNQWGGQDDPKAEDTTIVSTPSAPHREVATTVMSETTLSKVFQATPTKQLSSPAPKPKPAASTARPKTMPQVTATTPGRPLSNLHRIPQAHVNPPLSPTRNYSPISPKKRPGGTPTERARFSRSMEMLEIYGSLQHPYTRAEARSESQVLQIVLRQVVLENTGKNLLQLAARKISAWWKLMGPRKIFWRRWRVRNTVLSILDDVVSKAVLYSSKRRRLRARLLRNGATITLQRWYRVLWNRPRQAGSKTGKAKGYQARIVEPRRNECFETSPNSPTVNFSSSSPGDDTFGYANQTAGGAAGSPTRLSVRSEDNLSPLGMSPPPSRVSKSFTYGSTSRRPSSPGIDGARSSFYDVLRAKKRTLMTESSKFNLRLGSKKLAALLIQCMVRKKLALLRVKKVIEAKRNDKRKTVSRASLLDPKFARNFAAVLIQRIARGRLARKFVVKLLRASRVLNKLYRKTVAFGNLRRSLRRIDRPLTLTIRSIRNMPAFVYNTHEFLNLKVSIYWSPLLHIMPIDDAKSFITNSLPQFTVTFPNLNMERVYTKEEQEALAQKSTPTEARGLFSMGNFEKSPHSPDEQGADSDGDSSSSEEEEGEEDEAKKKLFNAAAFTKMRKKIAKSKFMKQFARSIRIRKAKRNAIPPSSLCMTVFDDACIKIPACHGNSIVKFDIFNELQKKVYSAFLHLGTRGRLMFWKEEMEIPLASSAARRSGAPASKNKADEPLEPIIELLASTGLPLRSRCGWAKVKIQGHGPLKRSIASKSGSSVSSFIFETWHRVYLSLDGHSLSMFDSKGSPNALNSIPAKHFASVTADKGQIFGGDGGSLTVKVEDNYDVSLRIRKNYEVLIFRFPDSGSRVGWIDVLSKIINENESTQTSSLDMNFGVLRLGGLFLQNVKNVWRPSSPTNSAEVAAAMPSLSTRPGSPSQFSRKRSPSITDTTSSEKTTMPPISTSSSSSAAGGSEKSQSGKMGRQAPGSSSGSAKMGILPISGILGPSARDEQLQRQQSRRGSAISAHLRKSINDGQPAGGSSTRLGAGLPGMDQDTLMQLQLKYDKGL